MKIVTNRNVISIGIGTLLALVFLIVVSAVPVFAAQCLTSVTASSSVSQATTGTNVVITTSGSGSSGCTMSELQVVSSPSPGFTIVDPPSPGYYSSVSVGTTNTFTVTAGTSGTYTYYARGTTTDGSVDSTSQILEFISPGVLTISGSPSSATITQGQASTLIVDVTNPQNADVATSYTLTVPSEIIKTGDPASATTTISAGSTKRLQWTLNHTTCYTGSKTVTLQIGDNANAFSSVLTGNTSCTAAGSGSGSGSGTDGGGSSGSGGGGGSTASIVTSSTNKVTIKLASTAAGNHTVVIFSATETDFNKLNITVNNAVNNGVVTIEKLSSAPSGTISPSGIVLNYIKIEKINMTDNDIRNATLDFRVPKTWIANNNINTSSITLRRYVPLASSWGTIETRKLADDNIYVYFSSTLYGFSLFSIVGQVLPPVVAAPVTNITLPTANVTQKEAEPVPEPIKVQPEPAVEPEPEPTPAQEEQKNISKEIAPTRPKPQDAPVYNAFLIIGVGLIILIVATILFFVLRSSGQKKAKMYEYKSE